ncbi:MAG: BadF/BadG/BcrA/BcrD ATPase family protein [Christensenellales bacterium]
MGRLRPLFLNAEEKAAFKQRHNRSAMPRRDIAKALGPCFLGLDAGSTTTKAVLLDGDNHLLYSYYAGNQGDPVRCALEILKELYALLPGSAYIASACVTGYGEDLIKAAIRADHGEIETVAHYKAASLLEPEVSFILDIGGQDMKCLHIRDGVIDNIKINEPAPPAAAPSCRPLPRPWARTLPAHSPGA